MKLRLNLSIAFVAAVLTAGALAAPSASAPATGVLLLAHGGSAAWNASVEAVARQVDADHPTEVAFGMATRAAIAGAVDRLLARGSTEIVAVPLFVSSHSSVITSTEYLLGLRPDAPKDLALFAKMNHGTHAPAAAGSSAANDPHAAHAAPAAAPVDPTSPIAVRVPLRMTPAFNRHAIVAAIVTDRARSISVDPAREAVVLVAHGPVPDDDNRKWLADMAVLAEGVRAAVPFAAIDVITVRDDAGPAMREAATRDLRALVSSHVTAGRRVLVVPHLMSFGGIEQGVRKRLEGLDYTMTSQALLPDARVADWVRASVAAGPSQ